MREQIPKLNMDSNRLLRRSKKHFKHLGCKTAELQLILFKNAIRLRHPLLNRWSIEARSSQNLWHSFVHFVVGEFAHTPLSQEFIDAPS